MPCFRMSEITVTLQRTHNLSLPCAGSDVTAFNLQEACAGLADLIQPIPPVTIGDAWASDDHRHQLLQKAHSAPANWEPSTGSPQGVCQALSSVQKQQSGCCSPGRGTLLQHPTPSQAPHQRLCRNLSPLGSRLGEDQDPQQGPSASQVAPGTAETAARHAGHALAPKGPAATCGGSKRRAQRQWKARAVRLQSLDMAAACRALAGALESAPGRPLVSSHDCQQGQTSCFGRDCRAKGEKRGGGGGNGDQN